MYDRGDILERSLDDVFSVIPPEHVISASREVVQSYLHDGGELVGTIYWAEFESDGTFASGGISDPALMASRLITEWQTHPIISEIVAHVRTDGIKACQLIRAESGMGHYWCVPYRPRDPLSMSANRIRAVLPTSWSLR